MLKLYGFPTSNFYNKVKLALMEKEVEFEEVRVAPSKTDEDFLSRSPMGKIPYIEHKGAFICETQVIIEYLEAAFPDLQSLYPENALDAARCRELMTIVDMHLDSAARPAYGVFFGREVAPEIVSKAREGVEFGLKALQRRAQFKPYLAGNEFTYADVSAEATLTIVGQTFEKLDGANPVLSIPGAADYLAMMAERPSVKKLRRAQKAALRMQQMGQNR